ncbi:asparagine synthase-related protein [Sphingomonas sp.]|uniref:asparagine synthase-related protein n=1 Tax=Sphingomonas sp. TaxID=28214 RepID=UPI0025ED0EA5|nr:asparagine synthase-related protein [Sphingomonas sp.]
MAVCFDGRLDNRAELLSLLGAAAPTLAEGPDSVLVQALVLALGDRFLQHLVGDFALAVWHCRRRSLLCARSATGWRPLLWARDGAGLAFATEVAILAAGLSDHALKPNEGYLAEILSARIATATETCWEGVNRLPAGGALRYCDGRLDQWTWYEEAYEDLSGRSDAEHVEQFVALFDQAIITSLPKDKGASIHVSGGLDSSSVFCRAVELRELGRVFVPLTAISARYPGEPQDETRWSDLVQHHTGEPVLVVRDRPYDIDAALAWCASTRHLPVRPNALGPTLGACRAMRERGDRLLLTGEGGDDWMAGSHAHWPDLVRAGRLRTLFREGVLHGASRSPIVNARAMIRDGLGPLLRPARRDALTRRFIGTSTTAPPWIDPAWASGLALSDRWATPPIDRGDSFGRQWRLSAMAPPHRDVTFDPLIALAERNGVTFRHPFHDLRLIRFFMGASGGIMERKGVRKFLLREAMRNTLPEPIRQRTDKAHFAAPMIDAIARYFERCPPSRMHVVQRGWVKGQILDDLFAQHLVWRRDGLSGPAPNTALGGIWNCIAVDMLLTA